MILKPEELLENLDIFQCEQFVNDRVRTSAPPAIPAELLPESGRAHPMLWARVPIEQVTVLRDMGETTQPSMEPPTDGASALFPIHPLQMSLWDGCEIVEHGTMMVSASYRTVFYSPKKNGPLYVRESENDVLMLKLHYEGALPGIPGDRSLSPDKVRKCLAVSGALARLAGQGALSPSLCVVREEVGMLCRNRGVLIRRLPSKRLIPGFSFHSRDRRAPEIDPLVVRLARDCAKYQPRDLAANFGALYARPLADALMSAFRQGFSLEMHPQNFLITIGTGCGIDKVYYRDMEGVVYSRSFRARRGYQDLFPGDNNPELHEFDRKISLYFNRNVDLDLARFWRNTLDALVASRYFGPREVRMAVLSVRRSVRGSISRHGLQRLALFGRVFRVAPSPYGSRLSRGFYRTTFR